MIWDWIDSVDLSSGMMCCARWDYVVGCGLGRRVLCLGAVHACMCALQPLVQLHMHARDWDGEDTAQRWCEGYLIDHSDGEHMCGVPSARSAI